MINKSYILLAVIFLITVLAKAQEKTTLSEPEQEKYKTKEIYFGVKVHSNGFALGGNYGFIRNKKHTLVAHFQIASLRHHREIKQRNEFVISPSPKSYIYGKRNSFYGIHLGFGGKYYFSEKSKRRAIAVALAYSAGPSIGLLKPYYLNIIHPVDNSFDEIIAEAYSDENRADFINPAIITGKSGFKYGLGEMSVIMGGYFQTGLNFDWGANHEFVKAIEVGLMVDAYAKTVPIMIPDVEDNKFLFFNLYLALQLGKRS